MRIHLGLKVLAPVVLLLAACTVTTTKSDPARDDVGGDSTQSADAGGGADAAPSPDAGADHEPEPSAIPADLVGDWTWTTSAGARRLSIAADGTYTSDVFLNGHPGESCGTEYFTQHAGVATVVETKLRLRAPEGTRTKTSSCSNTTLSKEAVDAQDATYGWRVEDDGTGQTSLLLVDGDGFEARYYPE